MIMMTDDLAAEHFQHFRLGQISVEKHEREQDTYKQAYNDIEIGGIECYEYRSDGDYGYKAVRRSVIFFDSFDVLRPLEVLSAQSCFFRFMVHIHEDEYEHRSCAGKTGEQSCI